MKIEYPRQVKLPGILLRNCKPGRVYQMLSLSSGNHSDGVMRLCVSMACSKDRVYMVNMGNGKQCNSSRSDSKDSLGVKYIEIEDAVLTREMP